MPRSADLKAVLGRILSGRADAKDHQIVQRALVSGKVIFTTGDRSVAAGSIDNSVIIIGNQNQLRVEASESAYEKLREQVFPKPPGIAPPFPALIFIGREDALRDVKQMVGVTKKPTNRGGITIVRGWPGVGKTTLVGVLGRDADIRKAFADGVLWTSLGQKPDLLSEMAKWGRALGTQELLRAATLDEATEQLRLLLQRKRMLLIVDDVWEAESAKPFIKVCSQTNSLLITTRETSDVAEALDAVNPNVFVLPVLTESDGLGLLRTLAPFIVEQYPNESLNLVRALECLPLSLHVAGSLLKKEAKMGWGIKELIKDIKEGTAILKARTPADRKEASVSALLKKSTDLLDDFTRECFAFLGVFMPPATFDLAALKAMWQVKSPKPIIRELVGHGLLEPIGGGRFQMHALLVTHAQSMMT